MHNDSLIDEKNSSVERWDVFEVRLDGPSEGNPYMDNDLHATFECGSLKLKVPGFYDGEGCYVIRFSPDEIGEWSFSTQSNRTELNDRKGSFSCVSPSGENHGPIQVVNTHYIEYADRSPAYIVGTTAYQWTSVKQSIQEKTIEALRAAPFNKIRMCVFPKSYIHGNETEPWTYPYDRNGDENDFERPNFEFFRNFDKRVQQLSELGIQADVILFHPYDRWGYCEMGKEMNEKYLRFMIARISAYRNVWWSLANEWDIPEIKDDIDWEGIGTILQKEDPHLRLRGIHNWWHSENHFYDHTRPWITHASTQTFFFFQAIKWRDQYEKPVLFDEMRYEGDVSSDWGNMSAEEMTDYFWKAALSGVYPTHGDTYDNKTDEEAEVRWWAKGGTLVGQSPERIAFLRKIMESVPVSEMTPRLVRLNNRTIPDLIPDEGPTEEMAELNNNLYIFSKKGDCYLAYTSDAGRTIELDLAGEKEYRFQVIDTWNMETVFETIVGSGKFEYTTTLPNTALKIEAR